MRAGVLAVRRRVSGVDHHIVRMCCCMHRRVFVPTARFAGLCLCRQRGPQAPDGTADGRDSVTFARCRWHTLSLHMCGDVRVFCAMSQSGVVVSSFEGPFFWGIPPPTRAQNSHASVLMIKLDRDVRWCWSIGRQTDDRAPLEATKDCRGTFGVKEGC